jgi:hypothetical protein
MKREQKQVMTEKKKLIRIEGIKSEYAGSHYAMNFAFVTDPAAGATRYQVGAFRTCRESLNALVRKCLKGEYMLKGRIQPHKVDMKKLRLLICQEQDLEGYKNRLFKGKAALNVLEDLAGWSRSKISTVVLKNGDSKKTWLLTGPGEWMSQPQLLSLATWVLRLSTQTDKLKTDSMEAFEESLKTIIGDSSTNSSDCKGSARRFLPVIRILLTEYKHIFEGIDIDEAWANNSKDICFAVESGLYSFLEPGWIYYSDKVRNASKRLRALVKETKKSLE